MKSLEGNLIELAKAGHFDLIAHGANCFCTFGAGIAKSIKEAFPEAYEADLTTKVGDYQKLGKFSITEIRTSNGKSLAIANLYTQYFWGPATKGKDSQEIRYKAIENSLITLGKALRPNTKIGLPRIGAGLAGGDWNIIEGIIAKNLPSTTIVTLPESPNKAKNGGIETQIR